MVDEDLCVELTDWFRHVKIISMYVLTDIELLDEYLPLKTKNRWEINDVIIRVYGR